MTDRAKALVSLGHKDYLNICSMPDLFHFNQPLARKAGASIGKAWDKARKAYEAIKSQKETCPEIYYKERQPLEYRYLWQENCRRSYQLAVSYTHLTLPTTPYV